VVVTTLVALERHLGVLLERPLVSVDIETIGEEKAIAVDPRRGRIRLVSLSVADHPTVVVDVGHVPLQALAPLFARGADGECRLLAHNAAFEQAFFRQYGFPSAGAATWVDTMLASQLLAAGTKEGYLNHAGLDEVVKRELGYDLDKTFQAAPWDGELSDAQYGYAAIDSACLLPLTDRFRDQLKDAGLVRVFNIETR
jgi:ribonuclease D